VTMASRCLWAGLTIAAAGALVGCQYFTGLEDLTVTAPPSPADGGAGSGGGGGGGGSLADEVVRLWGPLDNRTTRALALDATHLYFGGTESLWKAPLDPSLDPGVKPFRLLVGKHSVESLGVSGDHLYWTEWAGGIQRVGKNGSEMNVEKLYTNLSDAMGALAVDAQHVYAIQGFWTIANPQPKQGQNLLCGPISGAWSASEKIVATLPTFNASAVVLAGDFVYWHAEVGLMRAPRCSAPDATPEQIAPHSDLSYPPLALAVDGEHAYWTYARVDSPISRVALSGGSPEVLVESQPYPRHLAVTADHVYWSTSQRDCVTAEARILRAPKAGMAPPEEVQRGLTCPSNFATDSAGLYWADYGAIYKLPLVPRGAGAAPP